MPVLETDIFPIGSARLVFGSVVGPASYAAGGFASGLPTGTVAHCFIDQRGGYVMELDYSNKNIKAYFGDNNNAADGPLIEAANGTNLSAITFRFIAVVRP